MGCDLMIVLDGIVLLVVAGTSFRRRPVNTEPCRHDTLTPVVDLVDIDDNKARDGHSATGNVGRVRLRFR